MRHVSSLRGARTSNDFVCQRILSNQQAVLRLYHPKYDIKLLNGGSRLWNHCRELSFDGNRMHLLRKHGLKLSALTIVSRVVQTHTRLKLRATVCRESIKADLSKLSYNLRSICRHGRVQIYSDDANRWTCGCAVLSWLSTRELVEGNNCEERCGSVNFTDVDWNMG